MHGPMSCATPRKVKPLRHCINTAVVQLIQNLKCQDPATDHVWSQLAAGMWITCAETTVIYNLNCVAEELHKQGATRLWEGSRWRTKSWPT